jgi:hypothetical protein
MEEVAVLMAEFGCPCFDAGSKIMHTITEPPKFLASEEEEENQLQGMVAILLAAAGAQTRNPEERLKRALEMAGTGASAELRPKLRAALLRHADSEGER